MRKILFLACLVLIQGTLFAWPETTVNGAADIDADKNSVVWQERSSNPSTPPADNIKVFAKDSAGTTKLYTKDSAGTVAEIGGAEVDGVIGNEVTDATNATLTRSGTGTGGSPYTLGINLNHSNTWTQPQLITVASTADVTPTFQLEKTYSGTAIFSGMNDITYLTAPASNTPYTFSNMYFGISDSVAYNGTEEDNANEKSGLDVAYFISGASSIDWQDGGQTYKGYNEYLYSNAPFTGLKHDVTMIGSDMAVYNSNTFNNVAGVWTHSVIGNRILVQNDGMLIAGTLTRSTQGLFISVGTASTGTSTATGITIDAVGGGDTNYAINSLTSAPSLFSGTMTATKFIMASQQTYTPSNVTTDRIFDADATSTAELADILGTLIADLKVVGLIA